MRQNGHTPVEYITTLAMGLLFHGQARLLPRREPALEVEHVGKTRLPQETTGGPGTGSAAVGDDDGFVLELLDLVHAPREVAQRDVARARQVAGGEFLFVADVQHQRGPLVHEPRGLEGADLAAAPAAQLRELGPKEHHAAGQEERDQRDVVHDEFAHGRGAGTAGEKGRFYPIAHCRSHSAPIPETMAASTLRVRAATRIASPPAIHRGLASVRSSAPWCSSRPGATMAASTAGGTKPSARRKKRGKRCGSAKTMKEARSRKVTSPTPTMASQVLMSC